MTEFEHRWEGGHAFAQVAEALGVPTDHIVGSVGVPSDPEAGIAEPIFVLYTPKLEGDNPPVYRAFFRRDSDGILRLEGEPEEVQGFYGRLRSIMGEWMVPPGQAPKSDEGGD